MQVTPLWQKFKQLDFLDKEIINLAEKRRTLISEIIELKSAVAEKTALIEKADHDYKKMVHAVALSEAEITAVSIKIETKQKKLAASLNAKESTALEHEINALVKNCSALEDNCLSMLAQLETMKEFKFLDIPNIQADLILIKEQLSNREHELSTLDSVEIKNQSEQTTLIQSISPEWFAKYSEMKARVNNPIARVIQGVCGGCFYEILPQDLGRLKHNAILPCRSCFRLLYSDTEEAL